MRKKIICPRRGGKVVFVSAALVIITLVLAVLIASCNLEPPEPLVTRKSSSPPEFIFGKCISPTEAVIKFNVPVTVRSLFFEPDINVIDLEEGEEVKFTFDTELPLGARIVADIVVENADGDTLESILPFYTYNNRVPGLLINEIRTEYTKPKAEFIEFKVLSSGNLGAIRVFAAGMSNEKPIYEFKPIEVVEGEYFILHTRSPDEIDCIDEEGSDKGLSTTETANTKAELPLTVRDLWIAGSVKNLHKNDVIYIMNQDDDIIDAVAMYDSSDITKWPNDVKFIGAMELLIAKGAWDVPEGKSYIETAFDSKSTTNTKPICRDETVSDTNTMADWYIPTASSTQTPGFANKPRPQS
jgi:hypothetical protein